MKRALKYLTLGIALAALLAGLALPVWLLGTTAGTRRILDTLSNRTNLKISAEKIEGCLAGGLLLENLEVVWPQGSVRIQRLALRAKPMDLLTGRISFQTLSLRNVSISDRAPEAPPVLHWPAASGLLHFFSGQIERLEIDDLTYRHVEKEPMHFQSIIASVAWRKSQLSISRLQMVSDSGDMEGSILAGFNRPLLEVTIETKPSQPLAGMEIFQVRGKFGPGKRPGELYGSLRLTGGLDTQAIWELTTDTGVTSGGIPLKNIRLHRLGHEGLITADGMLTLSGPEPFLELSAQAAKLDFGPAFQIATNLSGSLTFAGTSRNYEGRFALAHQAKDWKTVHLAGNYSGNAQGLTLNATQGDALKGTLSGRLDLDWQKDLTVSGVLSGRDLDPAEIDPAWAGVIHFDLTGKISVPEQKPLRGEIILTLLESRLHGQQLTGDLRATFVDDDIRIQNLVLQGKGFHLHAAGSVNSQLDFTARISDVSRLIPQGSGTLAAQGRARWHEGRLSGVISAQGSHLAVYGLEIASADLNATLSDRQTSPLSANATFKKIRYQSFTADALTLEARGTTADHTLAVSLRRPPHDIHLALSGTYLDGGWQGRVLRLDGTDRIGPWKLAGPAALSFTQNRLSLEPLTITGRDLESLKISGTLDSEPLSGSLSLDWNHLNLARAGAWMHSGPVTGQSSGNIQFNLSPEKHLTLKGELTLSGTLQTREQTITIRQSQMTFTADEKGTLARVNIHLAEGGEIQGTFTSSTPARLALPDEGVVDFSWQDIDIRQFSDWPPRTGKLEGRMSGKASGELLPDHRFDLSGRASLGQSKITWQGQRGDVSVDLRQALINWVWRDETLTGEISMALAQHGELRGHFQLPLPARLPVSMDPGGKLQGSLSGQVREKGALGMLFPELIQESRGEIDVDLKISGTWADPLVFGNARLSGAGGYLPAAGITIKDAQIAARLDSNTIHIDSFRAVSGPGHIEGAAIIRMKGQQVEGYEGHLNGSRFQTIYHPELQVQTSPKLTFYGTPEKMSVRGEVLLPVVSVIGPQSEGMITASPDVIIEGRTASGAKKLPFDMDMDIRLIMGDAVLFRAGGIDAQLGGGIDLRFQDLENISGRGEIRVIKGRFRTYGVNLEIIRGRLFYAGGPMNQPALDILALRTVGDVRAGVIVSGTLQNPLVKLYSEPFMQDMDILAYIVLGHPLGSDKQQANLMVMAAGALLTSQQAEKILNQMKSRLGIDTFEISEGVMTQTGYMGGYKRISVAPAFTGETGTSAGVSETMLVVGKYLTPKLYISYGRSLFSGGNLLFLRYDLSKRWQIESQTGEASGIDIYYKLEFN